jgi:hypothetical protein
MGTTQPKSRARTWIVWLGFVPAGRITDTGPLAFSATAVPAALDGVGFEEALRKWTMPNAVAKS